MGIVAWNYIVEDKIIEKVIKDEIEIDDYIENYQENNVVTVGNNVYGSDLKRWYEMYEILKITDTSEQNVFNEIYNEKFIIETSLNGQICFYKSNVVEKIWKELKKYSIYDFEKLTEKPEIISEFEKNENYCVINEVNKKLLTLEFFETYKSFHSAYQKKKGIITAFG